MNIEVHKTMIKKFHIIIIYGNNNIINIIIDIMEWKIVKKISINIINIIITIIRRFAIMMMM